jgi:hypothetical protein
VLHPFPEKSRDQRIRDEFVAVGGSMGTNRFARHCISAGIWFDDELEALQVKAVQSKIRDALRVADASGLPFAGQTTRTEEDDERAPVWMQRHLWDYGDYALNIGERVKQRDSLHYEAIGLHDECLARFGRAPSLDGEMFGQSAAD